MEIDEKYYLKDTTRKEALEIMNYLIGFWEVKENELDFRE